VHFAEFLHAEGAVARKRHGVALAGKPMLDKLADALLVIDD
jgi:hypothetical protein